LIAAAALLFAGVATPPPRASFDAGIARVTEYGKPHARPLIFVPGLGCGPWIWDRQISALAPKYDIYALTLPGFDGRPTIEGDDLMRRAVDSIHSLVTSRQLAAPVVIGHSLGGTITVMFGETYPNDAGNLVTVEGGYPEAPTQQLRNAAVARAVAPYEDVSQAQLGNALRNNMLQYTITRPSDVAAATALAGRSQPKAIVDWMRAALLLDLTPELSKIQVPFTAIIPFDPTIDPYRGFKTSAAKLQAYQAWVAHAKQGKVVMIQPSRHFVMIDRAAEFETALESAIARAP
jgi:pimeloyl-ACP methyl ester carboxylesterase